MSSFDWRDWLAEWSRELLAARDPDDAGAGMTPTMAASGWLGAPGASEEAIAALEARLGARLPPSYRAFLRASDGFALPGLLVPRLLPTSEVRWLRDADPELVAAWMSGFAPGHRSDPSDDVEHRLETTLQVSAVERAGSARYLLDPHVVDADGEWQALTFADWVPGVVRHRSFRALLESERAAFARRGDPPPAPPARGRTVLELVRWIFRPPTA